MNNKKKRVRIKDIDFDDLKKGERTEYEKQQEGRKRRFEAIFWEMKDSYSRTVWMQLSKHIKSEATSYLIQKALLEVVDPDDLGVLNSKLKEYGEMTHRARKSALAKANKNDVKEQAILKKLNKEEEA